MMRKFSIFDIAWGNLRNRKRQYIMLAAGIVLAIYFAATSLLFGYGLYTSIMERTQNLFGKQDVVFIGIDDALWEDIAADDTVERLGKAEILGMVQIDENEQSDFPIAKYDSEAISITHRRLIEGAFPRQEGEIALSRAALARMRLDAGIGDTVVLTLRIPDGNDFLPDTVEKVYTLTGILYDQRVPLYESSYWEYNSAAGYAAGMVSPSEPISPGGRSIITAYAALYEQSSETYQYWHAFCDDNGINMDWNLSDSSMDQSSYTMVYTGTGIIIVGLVLVLASCLGIVNAFSSNLDARRQQIGLLRAVGATKRQIRRLFRRETLIIALIAAPAGIVLAVLSVYGAFALLGGDFHFVPNLWVLLGVAAVGILCIIAASSIPLHRAAAVSPMQTIRDVDMVRAVKKKAVKSKMQFDVAGLAASRANRIYKTRKISIGIMLAAGVTLFSISAVLIHAIVRPVLTDSSDSSEYRLYNNSSVGWGDVLVYGFHAPGLTEGDRQDIVSLPLVERVMGTKEMPIKIIPDVITPYATADGWQQDYRYLATEPLTKPDTGELIADLDIYQTGEAEYGYTAEELIEERNKTYQMGKTEYGYTVDYLNTQCVAVEEDLIERFAPYVYEGQINIEKLRSGEEVLLIAPERYEMYYTPDKDGGYSLSIHKYERPGERVVSSQTNDMFHAGDTISLSLLYTDGELQYDDDGNSIRPDTVRIDATAKIGALLDIPIGTSPIGLAHTEFLNVVTTLPGLFALGYDIPYQTLSVSLSDTPDPETEAYLQNSLTEIENRIPGVRLYSELEFARENRQYAFQLISAALALIILMMAITASMMNNTLSAHIRAGRRGIGTLRAVGVSDRAIFRNYLYQLLYLFAWGGGIGYVLSIILTIIIGKIQYLEIQNAPIPYWQPFLFIALLFGICLLNVRARLKRVLQESVIHNIRVLG